MSDSVGSRRGDPLTSVVEQRPTSVLVVDDGTIDVARSVFTESFPSVSTDSFAAWLGDVSAAETPQTDGRIEARLVELKTDDDSRLYRRYGVPPPDLDASRIEVFQDVTDLVEATERLDLFERLADRAQDGLYAADPDGRIAYCNASFADVVGADRAEVRGTSVTEYVAPAGEDALAAAREDLAAAGHSVVELPVKCDGEDRVVELHLSEQADRGGGHVGVARDVTERRDAERRLEQYQTLVESAGDPMYVLGDEGTIELANEAMADLFETTRAELVGTNAREVFDEAAIERGREAIATVLSADQEFESYELAVDAGDGRRWFEATVGVLQADDGEFLGSVATLRDVTDRRRQERDIDQLKRTLAHVARTNLDDELADVRAAAQELAAATDAAEAETISQGVEELATLPAKVGAIERIVDTDPDPVTQELRPLVTDAVAAVTDGSTTRAVDVSVPETTVRAIPTFGLAVENLVENALEHAGPNPSVTVDATVRDDSVELTVADDGPGVHPDELAVLHRGEETQLEHGSGVGLWVVDWVVRASGGALSYTGDDGARFTIELDCPTPAGPATTDSDRDEGGAATTETVHQPVDRGGTRVLAVDGSADSLDRITAYADDAAPDISVTATTAVSVATERLAADTVDCLVTERLPDQAWEQLLLAVEDVPVVLYTDADHSVLNDRTFDAIDTLVQKGVDQSRVELLVGKIRALTGDQSGGPPAGETPRDAVAAGGQATTLLADRDRLLAADDDGPVERAREAAEDGRAVVTGDGPDRAVYRYRRFPVGETTLELLQDVTPAARREQRRQLLETLTEQAEDGISVVGADGSVSYHNDAFSDILGYDDMVGDHASTFMAEGELERGQLAVQRLLASPSLESEVHDIDMVTADGETVTVADHFAVRYVDGEYAGLINVARDITERKRRERRLEQYRTLVESAGDPMYVLDANGTVELANEAMVEFTGIPREELVGTNVQDISPEEKIAQGRRAIRRILADDDRAYASYETTFGTDGQQRHFEVTVGVITDRNEFAGSVSTFREITERERRTAELTRLKQVLDRLLRHNLRNDLMVVMGQADILADRVDGEAAETAQTLVDRCRHLLQTADNARTVEKTLETDPTTVTHDLPELLGEAFGDSLPVDPPEETVRGRRELPTVLRLLAVGLAADDQPVVPAITTADGTVRLRLPAENGPLPPVSDRPATVPFEDETAVRLWLADWLVGPSGGTLHREEDAVELRLQRA